MTETRYEPSAIAEILRPELADKKTRYRCTSCHRWKWRRHFGDNRTCPDGRALQCKKCKRDASKAARDRAKAEIATLRNIATGYPRLLNEADKRDRGLI